MLGIFSYCNPTKLYFGEDALNYLNTELPKYGKNVVLIYGGGSIKKNGIYDDVIRILNENGKNVAEISGVMPNPTVDKLYEGVEIARNHHADFLLAVGGGSVCDYSKAVSVFVNCGEDPWEKYYVRFEEPDCETLPVGCVLTMAGTGSEMNAGAVITNPKTKQKIGHVFVDESIMPKFAILNPRYTMTLPHYQMAAGIAGTGSEMNAGAVITNPKTKQKIGHPCKPYRQPESRGLRGKKQYYVGGCLGAEYPCLPRQVHRLDGSYDRTVRRRLHQRDPRHDAGRRFSALLPLHSPLRPGEVQEICRECVGCESRG